MYDGDNHFSHDGKQGRCGNGEGYSWDDMITDLTDVWNCQAHSALPADQLQKGWTDLRISISTSCDTPTQATSSQTELPQKMCRNC